MMASRAESENQFDETSEYLDELRNDHLGLVGGSAAMVALRDLIRRVARSERPILISGPAGKSASCSTTPRTARSSSPSPTMAREWTLPTSIA